MSLRYIVRLISQLDLWICRDRQSRSTLHRRGSEDKKKEVPSSEVALCGVSGPWLVERPRTLLSLVELARVLTALPHHHLPPLFSIICSSILLLAVKSAFNHFTEESLVYFHVSGFWGRRLDNRWNLIPSLITLRCSNWITTNCTATEQRQWHVLTSRVIV